MKRSEFPILSDEIDGHPLIYLDNAATTQKPKVLLDALKEAYSHANANVHRGAHTLSNLATLHHEGAREIVAQFLGANSSEEIIFTRGTTDGLNLVARLFTENGVLHTGDEIVIGESEHHSNIVPWQMACERSGAVLKVVPLAEDLSFSKENFLRSLSPKTKIVSLGHISNVLGIVIPVEWVGQVCKERGIYFVVDGAQSAPHIPVNVQSIGCDFFVCSAHKMYGPTGLGVLYGKKSLLQSWQPLWGGGEMIEYVRFSGTTYNPSLPYRYEAGTPDFINTYAFGQVLHFIDSIGISAIESYECELTNYAEQLLLQVPHLNVYARGQKKEGIISFNVEGVHTFDLGELLDSFGVAVRTGHHCAQPLMERMGVQGTVRMSVALYNDQHDIDTFVETLQRCLKMLL